jgi:tRNA threonylcarbamoyladenosine biosynthesis protein TsaB
MNLLAFDTSTEVMSIGVSRVVDGAPRQWLHASAGGAQASASLIATVMDLLQQAGLTLAQLDAICFGAGPGAFTGLRTACAVAQGLAFGARVPVLPVDTLLALAEEAHHASLPEVPACRVTALLDARMDEMYAATYDFADGQWSEVLGSHLVRPEDLVVARGAQAVQVLAGNVFTVYADRLVDVELKEIPRITALPTAAALLRLAPRLLAAGKAVTAAEALPIYIRDKVAKTTAERMAEKAAAHAATAQ